MANYNTLHISDLKEFRVIKCRYGTTIQLFFEVLVVSSVVFDRRFLTEEFTTKRRCEALYRVIHTRLGTTIMDVDNLVQQLFEVKRI